VIEARGLQKIYRNGQREIRPLDGIDFTCEKGEFVLVTGRSGSGKTTFLNVLGGLTLPTAGSVRIAGRDLLALTDNERSVLRSEMMGFVFQFPGLMAPLTVMENVLLPDTLKGKAKREAEAREILDQLGLLPKADTYPNQLSGGELKRTAIARALINNPSLIFADEPTADLDSRTEHEVMELFHGLHEKGTTIVMITHTPELSSFATRVLVMDGGKLVEFSY
jgi:putative ABC transport system ATP-binding protein